MLTIKDHFSKPTSSTLGFMIKEKPKKQREHFLVEDEDWRKGREEEDHSTTIEKY